MNDIFNVTKDYCYHISFFIKIFLRGSSFLKCRCRRWQRCDFCSRLGSEVFFFISLVIRWGFLGFCLPSKSVSLLGLGILFSLVLVSSGLGGLFSGGSSGPLGPRSSTFTVAFLVSAVGWAVLVLSSGTFLGSFFGILHRFWMRIFVRFGFSLVSCFCII